MTQFPEHFAHLAAPFDLADVKCREQKGRKLYYITARMAMNRLDQVMGPENWWDDYEQFGTEGGVKCRLTLKLPDGSLVTKTGIGGTTEMHDESDTDKTGESDSLKRAAVKFGVARYLYRDGVPDFVRAALNLQGHAPLPPTEPARSAGVPREHAPDGADSAGQDRGSSHGQGQSKGHNGPPRSGKALFAWTKEQEQQLGIGLLKYLNNWAKLQEYPGRMIDWDAEQVSLAHAEALRKIQSVQSSYEEALSN